MLKVGNGHIISFYLLQSSLTWNQSILFDREKELRPRSHGQLGRPIDKIDDLDVHLGQVYAGNLWSIKNQPLPVWPRLTGSSFCGEKQLYCVTELLRLRTPKPTSFLTQCYVWVVSVTDQSKPGTTGSNGIWKRVISEIWIESMESRWSSSGQISQDSPRWRFSTRFKRWWLNYSVNQSNSKEGSSSCQCTMTLYGRTRKQRQLHCKFCQNYRLSPGRWSLWDQDPRRNGKNPS